MPRKRKIILKNGILLLGIVILILYIFCLPDNLFKVDYSTVVTDRDQELLGARIANDNQWRFPPSDSIPDKFRICLLEFEDRYFYYHWGVNPLSTARAIIQNLKYGKIVSGGSTITMQTIRLSRKKDRTWKEKIIEMILSTRLEFRYSKYEILNLYASHAPFGGNVVGLETAAWRYFGHSSSNLSWAESATLAILPNAPSIIHPSKNRGLLLKKRNRLLKKLYEREFIDLSTYELSIIEPLPEEPLPLPQTAPHLVSYFYQRYRGENCITTVDKGIQEQVELLLQRWNEDLSRKDIRNIAALVIDLQNNQVISYCGNVQFDSKISGNQVDIIRSPRSTGSILKPFLYCAMLQEGELLPDMLMPDIPLNVNGFTPQNFDKQFYGAVPASDALARSLNIPAVNALRTYSVPKFYNFLKKAGITTITKPASHYGLSLILGGAEANLWDISTVYGDMAKTLLNETTNRKISLGEPSLLLNSTLNAEREDLYDAGAVWQTFNAIKEVNRPEDIDWKYIPSMQQIAWKTGTSYGFRDAWAVGVTSKYLVGVWVGNSSGEGKPGLTGAQTAGPIMFDIFNILPFSKRFEIPYEKLMETEVCSRSGHLAGPFCDETDTIFICPRGLRTSSCPYHRLITVSEDERYRVFENCTGNDGIKQVTWFVLPPSWEWYYKQHNHFYRSMPPLKPGCSQTGHYQPMQFIYPQSNARITLPKQLDGSPGKIIFELAHSNPNATVYWHIDQDFIGATENFHKRALNPSSGKHSVTVVDNEGSSLSIAIIIE